MLRLRFLLFDFVPYLCCMYREDSFSRGMSDLLETLRLDETVPPPPSSQSEKAAEQKDNKGEDNKEDIQVSVIKL